MTRETKRQIARLRRLANEVLTNPSYDHGSSDYCVVGLGNRLVNGKISKNTPEYAWGISEVTKFAKKFGVSWTTADNIYDGNFKNINRNAKNWEVQRRRFPFVPLNTAPMRRSAASILNYIADRKEQGLTV
jgi:hypothetical protein